MNRRFLVVMLSVMVCRSSQADDFVVVGEAAAPAPIVVFDGAPPITREAAVTLADYIEKISGRRPSIVDGVPDPQPERAIWVGDQPAARKLFPQLKLDFEHPEEILLACDGNHLLIAGRDRWNSARLDVTTHEGTIHGKQLEYGTANAVFTFIQDKLGVRWLWPGELGEDVVKQSTIRIAPFEVRYHPQIRSRAGVFHYSGLGQRGYGRAHDWLRLQRLQLHSIDMGGGHGFGDWWERFHETHPEWFALQSDGTRSGFPNPRNAKLCESNPEVAKQWLADVECSLAADPTQTIFNASPNDGWASGHCVCEKCRAWDHPDGEPRIFNWFKRNELHPALTDRDVTFANRLGALLKQRYPGKDYYVLMMSYGHSRPAPIKARPADNVIISSVANFLGRTNLIDDGSTRDTTHREQFAAWTKIAPHLMWRPNTGSPAGWQQGLPDLSVAQTIKDFRLIGDSGCMGIYVDGVWEHWSTIGPQYYMMAHLTWNPRQDAAALLDDYYRRGFGPAADDVRGYYELLEKARMEFVAKHGYGGDVYTFPQLYTPKLLDAAEAKLAAAAAAAGNDELYRRRIAFVNVGLDYTRLVVDNARLMKDHWTKPDSVAEQKVRRNWEAIERLCASTPYAINWGPVRPTTPRMLGLHPDQPPPKKKKSRQKVVNDLDLN
ncbi:MAG: DUF4838 domain-containing protein [Planctomycetaceae bacterium]|nr:DUF4838 domain-containing protein [Planctomycetaceae bacterium]